MYAPADDWGFGLNAGWFGFMPQVPLVPRPCVETVKQEVPCADHPFLPGFELSIPKQLFLFQMPV